MSASIPSATAPIRSPSPRDSAARDVAAMTGIRGGCKIYCVAPTLRLLKAAGRDLTPPKGFRWYDLTLNMMDLEGSELDGEKGSWLAEDLDHFQLRKDHRAEGSQT